MMNILTVQHEKDHKSRGGAPGAFGRRGVANSVPEIRRMPGDMVRRFLRDPSITIVFAAFAGRWDTK